MHYSFMHHACMQALLHQALPPPLRRGFVWNLARQLLKYFEKRITILSIVTYHKKQSFVALLPVRF